MGYSTEFIGQISIKPQLSLEHHRYLFWFPKDTPRMVSDLSILETLNDPIREAVGLPLGAQGDYFVSQLFPWNSILSFIDHVGGGLGGKSNSELLNRLLNHLERNKEEEMYRLLVKENVVNTRKFFVEMPAYPSLEFIERYRVYKKSQLSLERLGRIDSKRYVKSQPETVCCWVPDESGCMIVSERSRAYHHHEWLLYLVENFFEPWGYKLNGRLKWVGEFEGDVGVIDIESNQMNVIG